MISDRKKSDSRFFNCLLSLGSKLEIPELLNTLVEKSASFIDSQRALFSVLDMNGQVIAYYPYNYEEAELKNLNTNLQELSVKVFFPASDSFICNMVKGNPQLKRFTKVCPNCDSLLAVPVVIEEIIYGWLYLINKPDGFKQIDMQQAEAFAAVTAVAIKNSQRYLRSRQREAWITASQELTQLLLDGSEQEDSLRFITTTIREVAQADTALLVLPGVGKSWVCEIADGWQANKLIGAIFPPQGRAITALREGQGIIVDSLQNATTLRIPELADFGPALYAPLISQENKIGVLVLLRKPGKPEFPASVLPLAESVVAQAALALEISDSRHAQDMAKLLNERNRIAQDLHDLAIQQLFATGMQLNVLSQEVSHQLGQSSPILKSLENALNNVDDSVRQIRKIVHSLKEQEEDLPLAERLQREASNARLTLGFAPSFIIMIDSQPITPTTPEQEFLLATRLDRQVDEDLADDIVAVIRESLSNIARHANANSVQIKINIATEMPELESEDIEVVACEENSQLNAGTCFLRIEISDDGLGMRTDNKRRSGIANMAARAARHQGSFLAFNRAYQGGLTICWQVPLT